MFRPSPSRAAKGRSTRERSVFDQQDPSPHFLRLPAVQARYSVSRTTLWRRVKAGQFPAPVRLFEASPTLFWALDDLLAWEAQRAAARPLPALQEAQP